MKSLLVKGVAAGCIALVIVATVLVLIGKVAWVDEKHFSTGVDNKLAKEVFCTAASYKTWLHKRIVLTGTTDVKSYVPLASSGELIKIDHFNPSWVRRPARLEGFWGGSHSVENKINDSKVARICYDALRNIEKPRSGDMEY